MTCGVVNMILLACGAVHICTRIMLVNLVSALFQRRTGYHSDICLKIAPNYPFVKESRFQISPAGILVWDPLLKKFASFTGLGGAAGHAR